MNKKSIKLYNVIFPVWLLIFFPPIILFVLPANFFIDLTVIVLTMKFLKMDNIKGIAKKVILKVWIFGFISDIIGSIFMFVGGVASGNDWWQTNIAIPVMYSPFSSIWGFMWIVMCLLISAFFIYLFNYKVCFKKVTIADIEKKKLSLSLTIFTAPYLFLLPLEWFY